MNAPESGTVQDEEQRDACHIMRDRFRLDIYTIVIIALIPAFFGIAATATWFYDRAEAERICGDVETYMQNVENITPTFAEAGTLDGTDNWLESFEALSVPWPAQDLHDAAISTITFGANTDPDLDVSEPGAVYDELTTFQDALDEGREGLLLHCEDMENQLVAAFPMFFTRTTQP